MSKSAQVSVSNRLLQKLPSAAFDALRTHLEPIVLPTRSVLAQPNTPIPFVHFIEEGIASNTVMTPGGRRLEIGLFGREGMSATSVLLGVSETPHDTFMQIGGSSLRLPAAELVAAAAACEPLRSFLLRYVQVFAVQMAQTALSNGSFNVEERTARWLLMCHDRVDGDDLQLTHEFLGVMLGVRRSGVTDSIHVLEGMGIIRARRGMIEVRDRARLEAVAGDSYGPPEAEYERLIGPWR